MSFDHKEEIIKCLKNNNSIMIFHDVFKNTVDPSLENMDNLWLYSGAIKYLTEKNIISQWYFKDKNFLILNNYKGIWLKYLIDNKYIKLYNNFKKVKYLI